MSAVATLLRDLESTMLRGSGTEPILRIYAEGKSEADAEALLKLGVAITKKV